MAAVPVSKDCHLERAERHPKSARALQSAEDVREESSSLSVLRGISRARAFNSFFRDVRSVPILFHRLEAFYGGACGARADPIDTLSSSSRARVCFYQCDSGYVFVRSIGWEIKINQKIQKEDVIKVTNVSSSR